MSDARTKLMQLLQEARSRCDLADDDMDLVLSEVDILVTKKLLTKRVLQCITLAEFEHCQVSVGVAKLLKIMFPMPGKDVDFMLADLATEIRVLRLERNKASQTTFNEKQIGMEYLKGASELEVKLAFLSPEQLRAVRQACQRLTGDEPKTFRAIVEAAAGSAQPSEDPHMQDKAMLLMETTTEAVGAGGRLFPVDTHKRGLLPNPNKGLIDCSIMAKGDQALWSSLVTYVEFKVNSSDLEAAVGQVVMRAHLLFEHQPDRSFAYALVLSLDCVRLCRMTKLEAGAGIHLEVTPFLSLSVGSQRSTGSPQAMWTGNQEAPCTVGDLAAGVYTIARLLASDPDQLGFRPPRLPVRQDIGNASLDDFQPLRQGTRMDRPASDVYQAKLGQEQVIVKMGCSAREIDILRRLKADDSAITHCIQLVHELSSELWSHTYGDVGYCTAVLAPVCGSLQCNSSLKDFVQVAADIAAAIKWLLHRHILHRDISANNIGIFNGRGLLFDFSAAKVMEPGEQHSDGGSPQQVTGTPLFVAYSLLAGGDNVHTESSHLESLHYSIWHSAAGRLPDEQVFRDYRSMKMWAAARRGFMSGPQPVQGVKDNEVASFLWELHQLFWPSDGTRKWGPVHYKSDVTVEEFVAVCTKYGALTNQGV